MHTVAIAASRYMYNTRSRILLISVLASLLVIGIGLFGMPSSQGSRSAFIASPFIYSFNSAGILNEAASLTQSSSPYWWLNSGGQLVISGGFGSTMQGDAPATNKWRILYALSNPIDTDNGRHPQNIFRLVSRSSWDNVRVQAQFKIAKDNWSDSPNRNASNGLLLMSRYVSGDTLYYMGIRVDGAAVIKKKYNGRYYTLAYKKEFAGLYTVSENINVLPHQTWIGLRGETITNADGSVTVRLFMQIEGGEWRKLVEARDDGSFGTPPITEPGFVGFRTDFMDILFENVRIDEATI